VSALEELEAEVVACRRCPRLVTWREEVARVKRASFAGEDYWGRPAPGFGDPDARGYWMAQAVANHALSGEAVVSSTVAATAVAAAKHTPMTRPRLLLRTDSPPHTPRRLPCAVLGRALTA